MELPELEKYFQNLTDITDRVSIINTPYESDIQSDIEEMKEFMMDLVMKSWENSDREYYELFTSYFTFHLKIVEEIIREAREILDPGKRHYVKQLVSYVKDAHDWFNQVKKKRKLNPSALAAV